LITAEHNKVFKDLDPEAPQKMNVNPSKKK